MTNQQLNQNQTAESDSGDTAAPAAGVHRDERQSDSIHWSWLYDERAADPSNPQPLPGPYFHRWDRYGVDDAWEIYTVEGHVIASFMFWDDEEGKSARVEANFRLLAAAPELLGLLRDSLKIFSELPKAVVDIPVYELEIAAAKLIARIEGRK